MNTNRITAKALGLVCAAAGLSMGNSSCDQQAYTGPRILKMDVEVQALGAQKVTLPDGEIVDFPVVANLLFWRRVDTSPYFVMINPVPNSNNVALSKSTGAQKAGGSSYVVDDPMVSPDDVKLLQDGGFMDGIVRSTAARVSGKVSGKVVPDNEIPVCVYNTAQASLGGDVISYTATYGGGIKIGYDSTGALKGTAGGSVNFKNSELDLGLYANEVLSGQNLVMGDSVSNSTAFDITVDFLGGLLGLNFFTQPKIADVIVGGMDKGLSNIVAHFIAKMSPVNKSWNDVWVSKVLYEPQVVNGDTQIAMRGGDLYNVQAGDSFLIYNTTYLWGGDGTPCSNALVDAPEAIDPIARAVVAKVSHNIAIATVTYFTDGRVHPGDHVHIEKLVAPVPPAK